VQSLNAVYEILPIITTGRTDIREHYRLDH
jgi:hypothetical protein